MAHGNVIVENGRAMVVMEVRCLGTFTGTIVKLFDDDRMSVQLDDGRIEFADCSACGGDDGLYEGQEVAAALMQFGGKKPKLMVFAYVSQEGDGDE